MDSLIQATVSSEESDTDEEELGGEELGGEESEASGEESEEESGADESSESSEEELGGEESEGSEASEDGSEIPTTKRRRGGEDDNDPRKKRSRGAVDRLCNPSASVFEATAKYKISDDTSSDFRSIQLHPSSSDLNSTDTDASVQLGTLSPHPRRRGPKLKHRLVKKVQINGRYYQQWGPWTRRPRYIRPGVISCAAKTKRGGRPNITVHNTDPPKIARTF